MQQRYPQLSIHAANYPPPPLYKNLATVVSLSKWAALCTIVLGERLQIWQTMNMQPPSMYTWAQEHKVLACFATFFLGNSVEGGLVQTGAFEVELNGMPIWSKLKSGRIPQGNELFDIINSQMDLSGKSHFKPPKGNPQFVDTPPNLPPKHGGEESQDVFDNDNELPPMNENQQADSNDFAEFDSEREDL